MWRAATGAGVLLAMLVGCAPQPPQGLPQVRRAHEIPLNEFKTYPLAQPVDGPLCMLFKLCERRPPPRPLVLSIRDGEIRVLDEVVLRYDPSTAAPLTPPGVTSPQRALWEPLLRIADEHKLRYDADETTLEFRGMALIDADARVPMSLIDVVVQAAYTVGYSEIWYRVEADEVVPSPERQEDGAFSNHLGFAYETCRIAWRVKLESDRSLLIERFAQEPFILSPVDRTPDIDGMLAAVHSEWAVAAVLPGVHPSASFGDYAQLVSAVALPPPGRSVERGFDRLTHPPYRREGPPGPLIHALPLARGGWPHWVGCMPESSTTTCEGLDGVQRPLDPADLKFEPDWLW